MNFYILGILCGALCISNLIYAEEVANMCTNTHVESTTQDIKQKLETLYERPENETDAALTEYAAFFDTSAQSLEEAKKTCPDQNNTSLATLLRRLKQCAQSFTKRGKEGCSAKCQTLEDQNQFNYIIRQKVVDGPTFEQAVKCARAFSSAEQKARLYRALSLAATKFSVEKGEVLFNTVKEALTAGKVQFSDKDKTVMKNTLKTIVAKTYLNAPDNASCSCLIGKLADYDKNLAFESVVELAQVFNKSHKQEKAITLLGRVSCLNVQLRGLNALFEAIEHADDSDQLKMSLVYPFYLAMVNPMYEEVDEEVRNKVEQIYGELPEAARSVFKNVETCLPFSYFTPTNKTENTTDMAIFLRAEERDYSNLKEYKFMPKSDGKILQVSHNGAMSGCLYLPADTNLSGLDSLFSQGEKTVGDWEPATDGYFCDVDENNENKPVCIAPSEDVSKVNQSELLDEFKNKYVKEYVDKRKEKCQK